MSRLQSFIDNVSGKSKAAYTGRRDGYTAQIKKAVKVPTLAAPVTQALAKAEAAAKKKRFVEAQAALDELERLIGMADQMPDDPVRAMAVGSKLEAAWQPVRDLPAVDPGLTKQRLKVVAAMNGGKFDDAETAIGLLEGFVSTAVADYAEYSLSGEAFETHLEELDGFAAAEAEGLRGDRAVAAGQAKVGDYGGAKTMLATVVERAAGLLPGYRTALANWESKAGPLKAVAGKLGALETWAVAGADALRNRLNAVEELASQKNYAKAFADFAGVQTDVENLHTLESGKRKDAKDKKAKEDSDALEESGSGVPELFSREDYEKVEQVQKPRVDEAGRRCGVFPELAGVLVPVTAGWLKVEEQVTAVEFLKARDLLENLVPKIDEALVAAADAEKREGELKQKVIEIKKTTDTAPNPPPTPELIQVWKAATDKLGDVENHLAAREVKDAEADFLLLGPLVETASTKQTEYDEAKKAFEEEYKTAEAERTEAEKVKTKSDRVKVLLATDLKNYTDADEVVEAAKTEKRWKAAKDAIGEMKRLALLLTAALPTAQAQADYETAYTPEIKLAHEKAAAALKTATAPMKKKLDTEFKAFEPKATAHDEAVKTKAWPTAFGVVGDLKSTAEAVNTAAQQYETAKTDFDNVFNPFAARHGEAAAIAAKPPSELADEVKAFTDANQKMEDEKEKGAWGPAKTVITAELKPAADGLVDANTALQNYFTAYGLVHRTMVSAYYIWINGPLAVKNDPLAQLNAFSAAYNGWYTAKDIKQWGTATTQAAAMEAPGQALIRAMEKYSTAKAAYTSEYDRIKPVFDDGCAAYNNMPSGLKARTECTAFLGAFNVWKPLKNAENWTAALAALADLETTSTNISTASFGGTFDAGAILQIRNKFEDGPFQTRIANAKLYSTNVHIQTLVAEVEGLENNTESALVGNDGPAALTTLGKLTAALKKNEDARTEYGKYKLAYKQAATDTGSKVLLARALGPTPAALVKARNKGLNATKAAIEALAEKGQFAVAVKRIAEWVKEAEGWIASWAEATEAQTALGVAPPDLPDEAKLNDLLAKPNGGKVLDALVRGLPDGPPNGPPRRDVIAKVMKARFGVDLELKKFKPVMVDKMIEKKIPKMKQKVGSAGPEFDTGGKPVMEPELDSGGQPVLVTELDSEGKKVMVVEYESNGTTPKKVQKLDKDNKPEFEQVADTTTKGSKTVKKVYELLQQAPEKYSVNSPSMKSIVRVGGAGGRSGGSYYAPDKKAVVLECGRAGNSGNAIGNPTELPDVTDPLYQPVGSDVPSYFDWTTVHEIGHAVDDKERYMDNKGASAECGGWTEHGNNIDPIAAAVQNDSRFKAGGVPFDLDYIKGLLSGGDGATVPPPQGGATPPNWANAAVAIKGWVTAVGLKSELWMNGSESTARAIGGRVYQEAYSKTWVSYDVAARAKGITGYQFRAPGEWFAELYAAYYTGKLNPNHPFARVVESL